MKPKVASFFSGIGAFEKAIDNLGIDYELVCFCEIDKYASKSYSAIHGVPETMNLGDITKVDATTLPKDIDLLTYGFPCQDISNAGLQKGLFNEDGSKTRSGLFFDCLRIIKETQPKIAIAENVKNLTSKRFANQFKIVLDSLTEAGYYNYWTVLNAKNFGIPQNRERVFIVSIRKDLDKGYFNFPEGFPLEKRLKDVLEDEVDEKYFLSEKALSFVLNPMRLKKKYTAIDGDVALCLTAKGQQNWTGTFVSVPAVHQIGNCCPTKTRDNPNQGRIYDIDGLAPALNCMEGGNRQPFVLVKEATKKGYVEAVEGDSINLEHPNSKTRRGRVGKQCAQTLTTSCNQAVAVAMRGRYGEDGKVHQTLEVSDREYANAITTVEKDSMVGLKEDIELLRIRKLTPKECFRLMGFSDEDFHKAEAVNSNSQLYKQAGNSIVVDVLEHILQSIFEIIK